jgi:hypothetical protein
LARYAAEIQTIYFPKNQNGKEIEKLYKGIRIIIIIKTVQPTNVIIMESRFMRMEERAKFLARR